MVESGWTRSTRSWSKSSEHPRVAFFCLLSYSRTHSPIQQTGERHDNPLPTELADVEILAKIHSRAAEVDAAKQRVSELVTEVSQLVVEAVDEGEPYRDIATAAGRSVGWVQVTMERSASKGRVSGVGRNESANAEEAEDAVPGVR